MRYLGILILLNAVLLPFLETPVFPKDVTLEWDKSNQVDGYKIYYKKGASGPPYNGTDAAEGDSPVDVGWVSEFTLRSLSDDEVYYIAITAYNSYGESGYSNEVSSARSVSVRSSRAGGAQSERGCFISTIAGSSF